MKCFEKFVLAAVIAGCVFTAVMMPLTYTVAVHYAPEWMAFEQSLYCGKPVPPFRQSDAIGATCAMVGFVSAIFAIISATTLHDIWNK